MKIKNYFMMAAVVLAVIFQSCDGYKKTDNGLKYKLIADSTGTNVEKGGVIFVNMRYVNEKDTFNSLEANQGQPLPIRIPDSTFKASLEEGLQLLSKGDSAEFVVSTDSLYKNIFRQPLPKEIKEGSFTTFYVKAINTITKDSVKRIEDKMMADRQAAELQKTLILQQDTLAIIDYCKKKGIKVKRTRDGVYYSIKKSVEGLTLQPGDTANTTYTGKLLNGTQFDSNVGKEPFPVVVGVSQVIRGWHSALMAMRKGEKATVYIPSPLGYGEYGAGEQIPPNSILIFDIEVSK